MTKKVDHEDQGKDQLGHRMTAAIDKLVEQGLTTVRAKDQAAADGTASQNEKAAFSCHIVHGGSGGLLDGWLTYHSGLKLRVFGEWTRGHALFAGWATVPALLDGALPYDRLANTVMHYDAAGSFGAGLLTVWSTKDGQVDKMTPWPIPVAGFSPAINWDQDGGGKVSFDPHIQWTGRYQTWTKFGGAGGKWEPSHPLQIKSSPSNKFEVLLGVNGEVPLIGPLGKGNIVTWTNPPNLEFTGQIQLKPGDEGDYFWPEGPVSGPCFTGSLQPPGSGGPVDFRGRLV